MPRALFAGIEGDPVVYLNGALTRLSEAKISVLDRGFLFGDGVYEVLPFYGTQPFRPSQHLARLARSLDAIRIAHPFTEGQWLEVMRSVLDLAKPYQYVYLQVTRGPAKRDHAFPSQAEPTVFAMSTPFNRPSTAQRTEGVRAITHKDERWLRCDIKAISLLPNVLARQHAVEQDAMEAILLRDGIVTEGAAANVWVVIDGTVVAMPKGGLILEGIRYGWIQEQCEALGIPFEVRPVPESQLRQASEVLLTSATREVLPVTLLDGAPVGNGRPGPIYEALRLAYDQAIDALAP